jgi:hypothetical protein
MSDDDMYGLDHPDASTEGRLVNDAVARYWAECAKARRVAKPIHQKRVDADEVVLEDDQGNVLARYPWIYDAMVSLARLK